MLESNLKPARPIDAEDVPLGTTVQMPSGQMAIVEGYRGYRRDHRVRLVCRYVTPVNRAFDVALILPELVKVIA
jgi:hypothetical protein